ncbi:MAG: glycine cleavage system aminomethyltransferase GcvT [Paludibacteraceae bacterium]|nr:glycine cleavage system aminomethyltransferase GcvT [Paludibacteraceae bacterium]
MKITPFTHFHIALGAKMTEFAGFYMPIEYTGINEEHLTVRQAAGVFDVSHMGEFLIKGANALAFLQKMTTNDVSALSVGKAQYSCFPNGKGGIVDDLLVYRLAEEKYLLVVNAANIEKDWDWCLQNNSENAELKNISEHVAQLAVQGPKATQILQNLTPVRLSEIPYYSFALGKFAGVEPVLISNTGYTGAGGFELYFHPDYAEVVWNAIFETGAAEGIRPIGLGARDTLRLEMGYCLYGNDIDETTSPIEAGLGWITKFVEGKNFIDRPLLEKQKREGVTRKLVRFELTERGIPRHGYPIVNNENKPVGQVTSGTMLPDSKKGIGMGYVATEYAQPGTKIYIQIRNKNLEAIVRK